MNENAQSEINKAKTAQVRNINTDTNRRFVRVTATVNDHFKQRKGRSQQVEKVESIGR